MTEHENQGIGWAIERLRDGELVTRPGWNGKGMYLFRMSGSWMDEAQAKMEHVHLPEMLHWNEIIVVRTGTGDFIPWLCSQADVFADDWMLAERKRDG